MATISEAGMTDMDQLRAEYDAALMSQALERIRQLETLNKTLAAEIDRQRPVVEAAVNAVMKDRPVPLSVIDAVMDYRLASEAAKEQGR
jgi:hypothetical protein